MYQGYIKDILRHENECFRGRLQILLYVLSEFKEIN